MDPTSAREDPEAVPGLAPPPPPPLWDEVVVVDGERFRVSERVPQGRSHVYDYDWLSGPNPGYGLASSGPEQNAEGHAAAIRAFLADIDPDTGYLRD